MPEDYSTTVQQYEAAGYTSAFECSVGGAPVVYFDTLSSMGHYIELWDNNAVFKNLFLLVEDAAKNWDEKDPIRSLAL